MIPYGRHSIEAEDIDKVVEVLQHGNLTQGDRVPALEQALAEYVDVPYVSMVNSATSALHLACVALGVSRGDIVWTSPLSFVASANCARYCGADVDFVDIDPETLNISLTLLERKLALAASEQRLPKAIVVVHFSGLSVDMQALQQLASAYRVALIEDASHALGADYQGRKVGCCDFADAVVFSFHPVKMITTGEGGAVLTRHRQLHDHVRRLRSHGIEKNTAAIQSGDCPPWYYEQHELGFNYRITDVQAALGLSQLQRLDEMVARRRQLASRYDHLLGDLPLVLPPRGNEASQSSWHLYVIQLQQPQLRAELYAFLHAHNIGVQVHYIPIHWQPYYQQLGFSRGQFPLAEAYYEQCLTLPLFPGLSDEQQSEIARLLHLFFKQPGAELSL